MPAHPALSHFLAPLARGRAWLFATCLALAACGGSPAGPTTDWIELKSLQPAEGTILTAGESLTFTATVTCTIATADGGMVVLLIEDQADRVLNDRQVPTTLSRGTATVTVTGTATIPKGNTTATVFIPVFVTGSNTTAMMKRITFSVR